MTNEVGHLMARSDFLQVLGTIADLMTILGVGGLVSWSITAKGAGPLERGMLGVLAASVRVGFASAIIVAMLAILRIYVELLAPLIGALFVVGPTSHSTPSHALWDVKHPAAYTLAYLAAMPFTALVLAVAWSVIRGTIRPVELLLDWAIPTRSEPVLGDPDDVQHS